MNVPCSGIPKYMFWLTVSSLDHNTSGVFFAEVSNHTLALPVLDHSAHRNLHG